MTTNGISINQMWQYLQRYQQYINTVVVVLLVVYLVMLAAEITWRFIPEPEQEASAQNQQSARNTPRNNQQQSANINGIQRLNLFGNAEEKPVKQEVVVTDAPQTNLNLTLTGVVSSTETQAGAAIIANKGTQVTYGIGEKVEGTNATVHEVYEDRIIIQNGSRMETLMLEGEDFEKLVDEQVAREVEPEREVLNKYRSPVPLKELNDVRNKPLQFVDYIDIQVVQNEGDVEGFRVNPGKDKSLFSEGFLQPNDIITSINGLDLTDQEQAKQMFEVLTRAQQLQITLMRNGIEEEVLIELPEQGQDE
ncbi:type II secretion system protein GspC [Paraneptunicella aestuarii]|uniref:type II secretion system protein GspC n=1 Tax=Paraneptunicella aestuarii TaxID=2831148 RepID=UPI001E3124C3|nr:type II secretion system protein GspC [Paraneptunicella aestuarii]UAA38913.1 type II secretion system protein GspC [Paraneptunicella aestuarii]